MAGENEVKTLMEGKVFQPVLSQNQDAEFKKLDPDSEYVSINDLCRDQDHNSDKIYCLRPQQLAGEIELEKDLADGKRFYRAQIQEISIFNQQLQIIKLTEVSTHIKIWMFISEKKLLKILNACVSHEMRNPLNAIFMVIEKLMGMHAEIRDLVLNMQTPSDREKIFKVLDELKESREN
jgi:hypothetical protein